MTAEGLKRRWMTFELSQEYVASSVFRFTKNEEEAEACYNAILEGKMVEL